jgi:hypothetical protein
MRPLRVPPRLKARLGSDESDDLAMLLQHAGAGWREDVLTSSSGRFEQVLATEVAGVRLEMHQGISGLRHELVETRAALREEMSRLRVEVLRWSFLFWIGQLAAITGLLSYFR